MGFDYCSWFCTVAIYNLAMCIMHNIVVNSDYETSFKWIESQQLASVLTNVRYTAFIASKDVTQQVTGILNAQNIIKHRENKALNGYMTSITITSSPQSVVDTLCDVTSKVLAQVTKD